jgi:capsular polysaccharide biosynthesis protein
MGMVYKARQPKLNRLVALKVLSQDKGADPRFAERFLREAQALARLDHPNIVAVHEFGEVNGLYFLVMEYVDGLTLRQFLRDGRLPPEEAIAIVPRICEALQYAHGKGVVHRDIKPENVLIDREGRVKIADFGIAKLVGTDAPRRNLTAERQVIGTPHYMAPEQVENPQLVDHRADIFSLGVVFYELLTGELPLGRFPPPSTRIPNVRVDVRLDEVVLRALEKEPERRYQRAGDVKTAVEHLSAPEAGSQEPAPLVPQAVGPRAAFGLARKLAVAVGALTFLIIAGITFVLPKSYQGTARLQLHHVAQPGAFSDPYFLQTEFERIQSRAVLGQVVANLGLTRTWGSRYGVETLSESACIELLRRMVQSQVVRNTSFLEVCAYSPDREEAAALANAIAHAFKSLRPEAVVEIVDEAIPPLRPARPNVPLNLALGAALAIGLALLTAGTVILLTWRPGQVCRPRVGPSGKARLALGLLLAGTLGTLMLMALSPRHELALAFGALALVLALGFGIASRHERLGKGVALAVIVLSLGCALVLLANAGFLDWPGRREARIQELRAHLEAVTAVEAHLAEQAKERERRNGTTNAPEEATAATRLQTADGLAGPPPAIIEVRSDGSGAFRTIQAAIDAAQPGTIIHIGPGRFEETLSVTQSITLQGAGWDRTIIGPTRVWPPPTTEQIQVIQEQAKRDSNEPKRVSQLIEEAVGKTFPPLLRVQGAVKFEMHGVKLTMPGLPPEGRLVGMALLELNQAEVRVKNCGLIGSPGHGILVKGGSRLHIEKSLVAAAWNTGIAVERGAPSHVEVLTSDIRNCHYAGITIARGQSDVMVRASRISGAAWHGVRYDDAAPKLLGNVIFGNARSGIYASGKSAAEVKGNVFLENEMNGISCWFNNADVITGNTFVQNQREALSILGASSPIVQSNIFAGHAIALYQGRINSPGNQSDPVGTPSFLANVFWNNRTNIVKMGTGPTPEIGDLPQDSGTLVSDPEFLDAAARDFRMRASSPALKRSLGCVAPLPADSPWPVQAEEKAIIPDGPTRDSRQWKR